MKKYATIFSFLIVLLLLGISFVAAADADGQDTLMLENEDMKLSQGNNVDLSLENEILESNDNQATLYENEATDEISLRDESQSIQQSNDILADDTGTYSGLSEEIRSGGYLYLKHSYYTYDSGDTILITVSGEIDGKGAIIDMAGSSIRAFYVNASRVTFKNLTIKNVNCEGSGGAIYFTGSGAVINCNFTDNKATGDNNNASAVYFLKDGEVTDCNFNNNTAYRGGAVFFGGNGTLKNSNFTNNNATYEDGAVCFLNDGEVTDCNFINNTARIDGGAIEIDGTGTLENCNFTNNTATEGNGGAIWTFFANIKNCNFALNTAKNGGAIRFYSNSNVTDCSFINNTAFDGDGGAILMSYGNVSNCDFVDNVASDGDGGAIWMSYANVSNCYFAQNTALDGDGGAIFSKQRCSTVDACIFKTSSDTININTPVLPPTLDVDNFTTFSNSGEKLTFDLKTSSGMPIDNGNITISLYYEDNDGWVGNYSCLSGEGWAVDLPVGSYYALFNTEYVGFEPVNRTIRIIEKTNILCSDISVTYDEEGYLIASLKDSSGNGIGGMEITVLLNGVEANFTTDENGTIKVPIKGLDANDYIAEITFNGNEICNKSTATVNVIVNKVNSTLTVDDIVLDYGDSTYIIVAPEGAVGISAEIDGEDVFVYNYMIIIPKLAPGNHTLSVTTLVDENHVAVTETANIEVIDKTPSRMETQIIYEDMTTTAVDVDADGRIGEYFSIKLLDNDGNALANRHVQIGFNGKVYDRTTDANGGAKLQINLAREGIYTFAISFLGDEDYNGSFAVAKITVNKQKGSLTVPNKSYSASAKTKALTATFKSASGKVVSGKKISFTVNGKTYSATTNAKGVATVKVSLNKKGTYSFSAKFAGDGTYAAISKSGKLTIK